ncbi:putative lipoprotein [[Clostridium] sordellii ATCC 9714]|nr:putative lipoprotein [[Clostridium] sordellii ATCC 9714] [Paeniclostridium sordellii ATCC 9714]
MNKKISVVTSCLLTGIILVGCSNNFSSNSKNISAKVEKVNNLDFNMMLILKTLVFQLM